MGVKYIPARGTPAVADDVQQSIRYIQDSWQCWEKGEKESFDKAIKEKALSESREREREYCVFVFLYC